MCDICMRSSCHERCPNAKPEKTVIQCAYCGEPVRRSERHDAYLFPNDEWVHGDCVVEYVQRFRYPLQRAF